MNDELDIQNRKYLGSKYRLLDFLEETVLSRARPVHTFIDGFAGTGIVAHHFRRFSTRVIANDILFSNYVINQAFLGTTIKNTDRKKLKKLTEQLNLLEPRQGYFYNSYAGTYFTGENAGLIDAVRDTIEEYRVSGMCTKQEGFVLLASLLYAADKVSNTVGQYDAFLKHLGEKSYDSAGRHRIDSNVYKRLRLKELNLVTDGKAEVYNQDLSRLIQRVEGDVLYLDPPYNSRQYIDCYHVLENIAAGTKPPLFGKTRKFDRSGLKSLFSKRKTSGSALDNLVQKSRARHLFLSYGSEGLLQEEEIRDILQQRGSVEIFRRAYPVFGRGAGRSLNRSVEERIYYCRTENTD